MSKNTHKQYTTNSPEQTQRAGCEIIEMLIGQGIRVVGLYGDLGAGKTQFVKGVAQCLGVEQVVNSPTFLIMKKYPTTHPNISFLYHFDCYRIENTQEMFLFNFNDIIQQNNSLVLIEWADKIKNLLPKNTANIQFEVAGENVRELRVGGVNL